MSARDDLPADVHDVLAELARMGVCLTVLEGGKCRMHGQCTDEAEQYAKQNRDMLRAFLGEDNYCRKAAEKQLQDDPQLRRAMQAEPMPSGHYLIGVAVRLHDGCIKSLVHAGASLDPWEIEKWTKNWLDDEYWMERSAIRELDGATPRHVSELMACVDLIRQAVKK